MRQSSADRWPINREKDRRHLLALSKAPQANRSHHCVANRQFAKLPPLAEFSRFLKWRSPTSLAGKANLVMKTDGNTR